MTSFKLRALAGVSALVAATTMGAAAQAATTLNGGGSTLLAPYWEQAAHCYDSDTSTFTTTNGSTNTTIPGGNSAYLLKGTPITSHAVTATTVACSPTTGTIIQMDATGSGTGQAGVLAHDAVISDPTVGLMFGSLDASGTTQITGMANNIQYGLSDNSLVQTDLVTYDVGTGASETLAYNGDTGTFTAPATYQGLTFSGTTHSGTNYPVTKPQRGPLVQFPASVDPVALSYNPTYGRGSTFTIANSDGYVHLDASAYCKIFTGAITNWNDAALTALNAGTSLTGGASVPIKLVGRSDSSGTTSIFTRHLAAVCGPYVTTNPYTAGTTTIPSSVSSLYTLSSGSGGVATSINSTTGAIGYIGADYVVPAVTKTGADAYSLPQAALKNNAGNFEIASAATASASFAGLNPPQSTSTGAYNSADTTTDRRDPTQWVQSTAATAPLANPSSTIANAYPIVGTTNFIGYTCYASSASISALEGFLNFGAGTTAGQILSNAALGQLPSKWTNAIANTFFSASGDASSLNLFLATPGASSANTNCRVSTVVGG